MVVFGGCCLQVLFGRRADLFEGHPRRDIASGDDDIVKRHSDILRGRLRVDIQPDKVDCQLLDGPKPEALERRSSFGHRKVDATCRLFAPANALDPPLPGSNLSQVQRPLGNPLPRWLTSLPSSQSACSPSESAGWLTLIISSTQIHRPRLDGEFLQVANEAVAPSLAGGGLAAHLAPVRVVIPRPRPSERFDAGPERHRLPSWSRAALTIGHGVAGQLPPRVVPGSGGFPRSREQT